MNADQPWTEPQIAMVEALYAAGYSYQSIADRVGEKFGVWRTGHAVRSKRRDRGLPPNRRRAVAWPKEHRLKLQALFAQGFSDKEIAEQMNRSIPSIKAQRSRQKLMRRDATKPAKQAPPKWFVPWPKNMPNFEDHPDARIPRSRGRGDYGLLGDRRRQYGAVAGGYVSAAVMCVED